MFTDIIFRQIMEDMDNNLNKLKAKISHEIDSSKYLGVTKRFLQDYVPKEVLLILDSLINNILNSLMDEAQKKIENYDIKLQRIFYEKDIWAKIKKMAEERQLEIVNTDTIKFSFDPRFKSSFVAGGVTLGIGGAITILVPKPPIITILAGLLTVISTGLVIKVVYDKKTPEAKKLMKKDIFEYIDNVRAHIINFLQMVITDFKKEFENIILDIERQKASLMEV